MSGESLVGMLAALSGIITAIFAGWVSVRRVRQDAYDIDADELEAHRGAWLWAIRMITRLRAMLASHDIDEPPGIDKMIAQHMDNIEGKHRRRSEKADDD